MEREKNCGKKMHLGGVNASSQLGAACKDKGANGSIFKCSRISRSEEYNFEKYFIFDFGCYAMKVKSPIFVLLYKIFIIEQSKELP